MLHPLSFVDRLISGIDSALRTLHPPAQRPSKRSNPADGLPENTLTPEEKKHIAGLMRVNHAGEVCAQALYQGQASTAKLTHIKAQMQNAAEEESDHLAWCEQRLGELESQPSLLNPFWYTGSFLLGAIAGLAGDRWSLGFVAETERQVSAHLDKHLNKITALDLRTEAILTQMKTDECAHAEQAIVAGGRVLPFFIKQLMQTASKCMTFTSYYI